MLSLLLLIKILKQLKKLATKIESQCSTVLTCKQTFHILNKKCKFFVISDIFRWVFKKKYQFHFNEGRKANRNNFSFEPHSPHFLVRVISKSSSSQYNFFLKCLILPDKTILKESGLVQLNLRFQV